MRKRTTHTTHTTLTLELRTSASTVVYYPSNTHVSTPVSRIRRSHGLHARLHYKKYVATIETMSETSERFIDCSLCSYGWCYAISMRALMWITSCFEASAARSGVTPLILRASNTTTRFSSRSCNYIPRILQKQSQEAKNPIFFLQAPYARFNRILEPTFSKF